MAGLGNDSKQLDGFWWWKGKADLWDIRLIDEVRCIVYGGELQDLGAIPPYRPLDLGAETYSAFSELGGRAKRQGAEYAAVAWTGLTVDTDTIALFAAVDPSVQRAALRFVRRYGLHTHSDRDLVGVRLSTMLKHALDFHDTLQLLVKVRGREAYARQPENRHPNDVALLRQQQELQIRFWDKLQGVRLGFSVAEGGLTQAYTCTDLLSAMYFQLWQEKAAGSWRQCRGCERWFIPRRRDQWYHSPACRNRANVRLSTSRKPKPKGE